MSIDDWIIVGLFAGVAVSLMIGTLIAAGKGLRDADREPDHPPHTVVGRGPAGSRKVASIADARRVDRV